MDLKDMKQFSIASRSSQNEKHLIHSFISTFTTSLNQAFIVLIFMFIIQKEKKQSLFTWDQ